MRYELRKYVVYALPVLIAILIFLVAPHVLKRTKLIVGPGGAPLSEGEIRAIIDLWRRGSIDIQSGSQVLLQHGNEPMVRQTLLSLLTDDDIFPQLESSAILFRLRVNPNERLMRIVDSLDADWAYERETARNTLLMWLDGTKDAEFLDILVVALRGGSTATRESITWVLAYAFAANVNAVEAITTYSVHDPVPEVRKQAADSIFWIADQEPLWGKNMLLYQSLLDLLHDPDPTVSIYACQSLRAFPDMPGAKEIFLNLLHDDDPQLRSSSLESLAYVLPDEEALPLFIGALDDEDLFVKAINLIGRMGPKASAAIPRLRELAENDDPRIAWAVQCAILAIEGEAEPVH